MSLIVPYNKAMVLCEEVLALFTEGGARVYFYRQKLNYFTMKERHQK